MGCRNEYIQEWRRDWGAKKTTVASDSGNRGIPLVQPNGTVILPVDDPFQSGVLAFNSTNGGASWSAAVSVAPINRHGVSGGLRAPSLLAAQIDGAGKVYVAWADCSFRAGCASNDIVMSTSTNGTTWTTPSRIPIDAVSTKVNSGQVDAAAFDVSKGGLFRSFSKEGPGRYRLHTHIGAGQLTLLDSDD